MTSHMRRRRRRRATILDGLVAMVVGAFVLGGLYWTHLQQQAFANTAEVAQGEVIRLEERTTTKSNGSTSRTYAPVIQFLTTEENVLTFTSPSASNPPSYSVGDKLDILYNPANPADAIIAAENSIFTNKLMWMVGGVGIFLELLGMFIISRIVKRSRQKPVLQTPEDAFTAS